ncbi:hypothetical protein EBZ39_04835 [bacterium]|nr:hypothetical protein [bacterium]
MEYIVKYGQNLIDVVLTNAGTMEAVMDVAAANGIAISDVPEVGAAVNIGATIVTEPAVVKDLRVNGITIATLNS